MTKRPNLDHRTAAPYGDRVDVEPFISSEEVCRILGVSRGWLYGEARGGKFPSYKFGSAWKFRLSEIKAWAEAQQQKEEK